MFVDINVSSIKCKEEWIKKEREVQLGLLATKEYKEDLIWTTCKQTIQRRFDDAWVLI